VIGWVSASVVTLGGNCTGVSSVALPTSPPQSNPPTSAPTNAPGSPPTSAPTEAPPDAPRLNPSADPGYLFYLEGQRTILSASMGVAAAPWDVDASYLGGGCAGFVSHQPTLNIILTDPLPGLLRFYFVHNDATDPVMIIEDPDGNFHCGDDSYGTVNPTIDLNGPSGGFPRTSPPSAGRYIIWIGTHNGLTSGSLWVTNDEDYHP
ncbi:MAG: hypothetical protein ABI835_17610, partial [Chloroflexota bacterium]